MAETGQPAPGGSSRRIVWTMAIASGATVANLYYNQPLLPEIARSFSARGHAVGLIPTMTQIGYGLGMLLVVPLGDTRERRSLVVACIGAVAVTLVAIAVSPNLSWLLAASLAMGIATCVPQILVPLAANLAAPGERGRAVGTVMSGLLFGILLSRTVSGFLGAALGWRAMYLVAAGMMVVLGIVLRLALPRSEGRTEMRYGALRHSLGELIRSEPVLRLHAALGALTFAAFSAFWATLALHLHALPGHYGPRTAGAYGALGILGALAAPLVGKKAEARGDRRINVIATCTILASFAVLWWSGDSLWGLGIGCILLDFGAQANHISNQTRIFALREDARSRLNTVYMVTYFAGGALGAYAGALAFSGFGWNGVCVVGGACCAAALALVLLKK
jgi:predicted MFS family arabinose efflux permease